MVNLLVIMLARNWIDSFFGKMKTNSEIFC